jgi:hypothetical protein
LADKKAAKRRRRENKEAREKAKAERTGPSPAQQAEAVRNVEAEDPRHADRRTGLDGSVGATPPATADRRSDALRLGFDLACGYVVRARPHGSGRDAAGRATRSS